MLSNTERKFSHVKGTGREVAPRLAARPRRRRPAAGALLPTVLAVLAGVFAYQALQSRAAMTDVLVARTYIAAGQPVNAGNTRRVEVHASDAELDRGLVAPSQLADRFVATVDLPAGEPVTSAELATGGQGIGLGAMSLPVPEDQAVGGALAAGDLVDVIQTGAAAGAKYVAQDLRVLEVAPASSGLGALGATSGQFFVVVAVNRQVALALSAALAGNSNAGDASSLEVVRLPTSTGKP